jgi:hypothetical protein
MSVVVMVKVQSPRAVPLRNFLTQFLEDVAGRNANQWAEIDAGTAVSIPRSIIVSVSFPVGTVVGQCMPLLNSRTDVLSIPP